MDKLTADTITDKQIDQLEDEAAVVLDHVQVALCQIALIDGDGHDGERVDAILSGLNLSDADREMLAVIGVADARQRCADAINNASAQADS